MESNMLLQLKEMCDNPTLQPSTWHVCVGTGFSIEFPRVLCSVHIGCFFDLWHSRHLHLSRICKDFLAAHSAVSAVPMIAASLFSASGSILPMEVIRVRQGHPTTLPSSCLCRKHWPSWHLRALMFYLRSSSWV